MTSFIDDLSQLNVKQGTAWVVQMLYNVKNYNNDVLLLCTLLRERRGFRGEGGLGGSHPPFEGEKK